MIINGWSHGVTAGSHADRIRDIFLAIQQDDALKL
jgi:hypothetical protein